MQYKIREKKQMNNIQLKFLEYYQILESKLRGRNTTVREYALTLSHEEKTTLNAIRTYRNFLAHGGNASVKDKEELQAWIDFLMELTASLQ